MTHLFTLYNNLFYIKFGTSLKTNAVSTVLLYQLQNDNDSIG